MIFKLLATLRSSDFARRLRAWKPLLHAILVARIALTVLMVPRGVASQEPAVPAPASAQRIDAMTARSTEEMLAAVFRTQTGEGAYTLANEHAALATHPIFATMALDAYYTTRNLATLSQATYSVSRYYSYLLSACDRDGDRLVESPAPWHARDARLEDPAYNALLAVDARNLARANLELRRPMPALYWYDGGRTIERALVGTFDPGAGFFFPRDPVSGQFIRHVAPPAALPSTFSFAVGANYGDRMRAQVVRWASETAAAFADPDRDGTAVDCMAAVMVLNSGDHATVVDALRRALPATVAARSAVERYALGRSRTDAPPTDDDVALSLLLHLARSASMTDSERFRLERAVPDVRQLALAPHTPPIAFETASASVKTVYAAVATLRERLRASSTFFSADDRRAYPGGDANVAAQRVLDDVACLLRRAENRLFAIRYASAAARVLVSLDRDDVVVSEGTAVRWEISAMNAPLTWTGVSAGVFGEAISPVDGSPVRVAPGVPLRFTTRYPARGAAGSLRLVTFTAVFENGTEGQARYHIDRSIYVNPPIAIVARFPRGRMVEGSSIPLEVRMHRHSGSSTDTKYFWFSPGGLRLTEGNSGLLHFGTADSAAATLHIEIPTPCRPGVFPFTIKFYSGDREAGTIASSLFKPYQWTYVGPFAADGGITKALPPEQGINLLQTYGGPNGSLRWRPVPAAACDPRGGVSLRNLATDRGTSYLYTIVGCAYETDMEARLSANGPAALFVNGRKMIGLTSARGDSARASVHLDPDKNHILIKVIGDRDTRVSFALGNDDNLAVDEFDNNLAELAGGYREITARELASGSAPSESRRLVTLRFEDAAATSVAVVGSFNGWSPESHPMQKQGDVWELTLSLAPGRYAYRFLIDKSKQVLDPSSPATEPDGYGGKNSVLVVKR